MKRCYLKLKQWHINYLKTQLIKIALEVTKFPPEPKDINSKDIEFTMVIFRLVGVFKEEAQRRRKKFTRIYKKLKRKSAFQKPNCFKNPDDFYRTKATIQHYKL